ncbi:aminotransferase class I/II-fold pyridoxal phosphate-dependent enzyme [Roseibium sp.]|uniref:aminotransferase class I/II-fold pyridoxal phosphate-dependent enzyme n=1 Tax=Roseibium sp. TaxID=1936156 RepID=UPI003BAAA63C
MSSSSGKGGLDSRSRQTALDWARRSKNRQNEFPSPNPVRAPRASAPDFSTLPGFQQMKLQKAAADLLGIENPFFKTHDQRAGPTAVIDGKEFLNFASYDYLGLNGHPAVIQAAKDAADRYGMSASASRIVSGERKIHGELEQKLAALHEAESAVVFVSGHATNVSTIGHILQKDDLIVHDAYIHNSIVTGAKLSGAVRQAFQHNDLDSLETILKERAGNHGKILIVVEGVYSMDGDMATLPSIIELKEKYGAWLMVDEAHSIGILGETGRGIAEHYGVDPSRVDIWMGTLSKTLASCGGYIAGKRDLIDFLKFTASGFVFSVGLSPALAASASTALDVMQAEPERVQRAQQNGNYFLRAATGVGLDVGVSQGHAIVPLMIGDSLKATVLASRLSEEGVNVLPIIFPAVPEKSARLRYFITSEHTEIQIDNAINAFERVALDFEANPVSLNQLTR